MKQLATLPPFSQRMPTEPQNVATVTGGFCSLGSGGMFQRRQMTADVTASNSSEILARERASHPRQHQLHCKLNKLWWDTIRQPTQQHHKQKFSVPGYSNLTGTQATIACNTNRITGADTGRQVGVFSSSCFHAGNSPFSCLSTTAHQHLAIYHSVPTTQTPALLSDACQITSTPNNAEHRAS